MKKFSSFWVDFASHPSAALMHRPGLCPWTPKPAFDQYVEIVYPSAEGRSLIQAVLAHPQLAVCRREVRKAHHNGIMRRTA
jgi:hypothetical protein